MTECKSNIPEQKNSKAVGFFCLEARPIQTEEQATRSDGCYMAEMLKSKLGIA